MEPYQLTATPAPGNTTQSELKYEKITTSGYTNPCAAGWSISSGGIITPLKYGVGTSIAKVKVYSIDNPNIFSLATVSIQDGIERSVSVNRRYWSSPNLDVCLFEFAEALSSEDLIQMNIDSKGYVLDCSRQSDYSTTSSNLNYGLRYQLYISADRKSVWVKTGSNFNDDDETTASLNEIRINGTLVWKAN